jgi:hypothetical protein
MVLMATLGLLGCAAPQTAQQPAMPPPMPTGAPVGEAGAPGGPGTDTSIEPLVVKNADLTLEVADVGRALEALSALSVVQGGYVLESSTATWGDSPSGMVRFTVPVDRFEEALSEVRALADRVVSESATGQDVTAEYIDLGARLSTLEGTRDRVREFLAEAETVDESLAVSQELSRLDAEIESIKGQMQYLSGRAAFSTITVNLSTTPTVASSAPWSPGATLERAANSALRLAQGLGDAAIWIVVGGAPLWIAALLALLVLLGAIRWLRRPRPAPPASKAS